MLKIRISGSKQELEEISTIMQDAEIKKFKHKKGHTTYAIDSRVSVKEFLSQNEVKNATVPEENNKQIIQKQKEELKDISHDLSELLDVIQEDS